AVVIGGVNVFGGSGTVLGAMLGALLVATIDNGFTLLRFDEFWKIFFEGAAIVVAVTVDALMYQRLQELLRRRRRPELAVVGGRTWTRQHGLPSARPRAGRRCSSCCSSAQGSGAGRSRASSCTARSCSRASSSSPLRRRSARRAA